LRPLADAFRSASTVEQIANALVSFGLPALNACVCVLALLSEDESEFFCPRIAGYPDDLANAWRHFPADAHLPISKAVRDGKPIYLETLERRQAFYLPDNQLPPPVGRALAAIPLRMGEVTGALGFTFPDDRSFEEGERDALKLVAALCAEALVRVRRSGLGYEVLVVDDEPGILKLLDFALRYHAFTVRGAASGKEAVQIYQGHWETIAAVLLDVQMPGQDGPKTLGALREINPEIGCVFMSGNTGRYSSEELLAVGGVRVLQKPFSSLDEVIQSLRKMAHR
jgi:two-component system, OmpR family, response regulator